MNLVIFGPPGAGKGTQSKFIAEKFNLFQLSTGEFLRKEISNNTPIGKKISSIINEGNLVSDQIVSGLIEKIISKGKDRDESISIMKRALDEIIIDGINTNIELHKWILKQKDFIKGNYNTNWLENNIAKFN